MTDLVKLLFEIPSKNSEEIEIESIWALPEVEGFRIDNIPFYAKGIAIGDVVSATERNGAYYFDRVLVPSRHSTIRIVFFDEAIIQTTRDFLRNLGCESELSDIPALISVDIPPSVNYESIKKYLDSSEESGLIEYQEACLGARR